jgi:hypothetical protein
MCQYNYFLWKFNHIKKRNLFEIINRKGTKGSNVFTFHIEIHFHFLSKENKWFELALYICNWTQLLILPKSFMIRFYLVFREWVAKNI